jgi:hypothetical protein
VSRTDVRHRSLLSFAIRVALVVIVVVGAVYWVLLSDLQRALKQRLERLYALGVPKTWADVAPPEIPDRDNAAVLYVEGFNQVDTSSGPAGMDLRTFLSDKPPGSRQKLRPNIEALLARNRAALELIKRGAMRPRCRFPTDWSAPDALIFSFIGAREAARLLAADALIGAENGDTEPAIESIRAGLRLSRHIASEPDLIPFLTAATIEAMTLRTLSDVVQQADLTPSQCRILYDELGRLDWERHFHHALASEGCSVLWYFDTVQRSPREGWDLVTNGLGETPGGASARPLIGLYLSPLGRPLRLNEEIQYCDRLADALNFVRKPFPQGPAACREAVTRGENLPGYWLISQAVVDPSQAAVPCYRAIAYRNAMQVALALKAYRAERGSYPDSLAALSQRLGWKMPPDPYSGKPFVYHRKGAGFVLYSFGEDLDDDGGQPFAHLGLNGDWVWEFKR